MRENSDSSHKELGKELQEQRMQNDDLHELLRTKERMLDDQLS